MGSRPALDRYELTVSLFCLQAQKLLDIAPLDCPALLVRKLHYEFRVPNLVDAGLAHRAGVPPERDTPCAEHAGVTVGPSSPLLESTPKAFCTTGYAWCSAKWSFYLSIMRRDSIQESDMSLFVDAEDR